MTQTSNNETPTPDLTQRDFLLRFWKCALEVHGMPAVDYAASKASALRLLQMLDTYLDGEDAARRAMLENREGTLGLLLATHSKAAPSGLFREALRDIPGATSQPIALDRTNWQRFGTHFFHRAFEEFYWQAP